MRLALNSVKQQDGKLLLAEELAKIIQKENSVEKMIAEYRKVYKQLV